MKKLLTAGVVALGLIVSAQSVSAQSIAELQAMIAALQAQLAALAGQGTTTTTSAYTHTVTLKVGSKGAQVTALQSALNSLGFNAGAADGIFGNGTKAAVVAFQASKGLTADGIVGPATGAALSAATVTSGGSTGSTSGTLNGGEADVRVKKVTEGALTINVDEADTALAMEFDVRDADIQLSRVDAVFDARPWLYFDEVNLLVNGKEVKSLSKSSDFSDIGSGKYRARFSGLSSIIKEGTKAEIALELVVKSDLGTRNGDTVKVEFDTDSVRYTDASGLMTEDGYALTALVTLSADFGTLKVSANDESPKNSDVIVLDTDNNTKDVVLAIADVTAKDNNVEIKSLDVEMNTLGANVEDTVLRLNVLANGTKIGNELVSGAALNTTTTISDLDYVVKKGKTVEFSVEAEFIKGTAATSIEVDNFDFVYEDADYSTQNKSVSFKGEFLQLVEKGLTTSVKSITHTVSNEGKTVQFVVKLDATAVEEDVYFQKGATGYTLDVNKPAGATESSTLTSNATENAGVYKIAAGQTKEIIVTVAVAAGANAGFVDVTLDDIDFGFTISNPVVPGDFNKTLILGGNAYTSQPVYINA